MIKADSFRPSEAEAATTIREVRWEQGVVCPHCGSDQASRGAYRPPLRRYECGRGGRWFNDLTGPVFEHSKVGLRLWVQALYLVCLNKPTTVIAEEWGVSYPTAWRRTHGLRRSGYEQRVREPLDRETEGDETYVKAGPQGQRCTRRRAYRRGRKQRGRGSWPQGRPPLMAAVERRRGRVRIAPVRRLDKCTVAAWIVRPAKPGTTVPTDDFASSAILGGVSAHQVLCPSQGSYAPGDRPIHTAEAEFSVYKLWLAVYRGVSLRYLYLYGAHYEFLRAWRDQTAVDPVNAWLYATVGRSLPSPAPRTTP